MTGSLFNRFLIGKSCLTFILFKRMVHILVIDHCLGKESAVYRFRHRFLRKHILLPVRHIFLLTLILFVFSIIFTLWFIDKGISPPLMEIAERKTIEYATRTINSAVKSTERLSFDDLVDITIDTNGNVSTLGWDSQAVNRALRTATERAEYFLYGMNNGEQLELDDPDVESHDFSDDVGDLPKRDPTVVEIPIGQATGNAILANLGPKIPVHFEIVGNITTDVVHEVKEFGVNAALLEIYIPVSVQVQIVIPFSTTVADISTRVFVDSRVIMGDVPKFFSQGSGSGPVVSFPRDVLK